MGTSAAIDVAALRADFPILSRRGQRRAAGVPRLGGDLPEARRGAGRDGGLLPRDQRQRPPGRLQLAAEATEPLRGRARRGGAPGRARRASARSSPRTPARRSTWWPGRGASATCAAGDEILVTEMEHHSNIVPWQIVAEITGAAVRFVPVTPGGELDMDALRGHALRAHPDGRRGPRQQRPRHDQPGRRDRPARPRAGRPGAGGRLAERPPHAGRLRGPRAATSCAFTGHKMLGPTGIGVLVGRPALLESMEPFLGGGEMISNVTTRRARPGPRSRGSSRPGRPPIAEAVGLGAAADYLAAVGLDAVRAHEVELVGPHARRALSEVEGITIYGPRDPEARGGRGLVQPAGHPPARHRPAHRPRGRLRPGRPPLRQAAHARARAWAPRPARAPTSTIPTMRSTCSCAPWATRGPRSASGRIGRAMGGLDDLYQELILDHYRRKRGEGPLDQPLAWPSTSTTPSAGTRSTWSSASRATGWSEVAHTGEGCSISQASVSMMSEALSGLSVDEALAPGGALPPGDARRRGGRRGPAGRRDRARGRGEVPGAREVRAAGVDGREGRDPDLPTQREADAWRPRTRSAPR